MLSWNHIGKVYGRRRLFADLSGHISPGEGMVVTGINGSGKSTFLKTLAGLVRPDTGSITRPDDRNAIGYAAPHLFLYGELTGLENLVFYAELRGRPLDRDAALALLAQVDIERAASKPASVYSTGMTQRLRLACALAHDPPLLLLDEPTIGLDAAGVTLVEQIVAERAVRKIYPAATIIASNDPGQCARFEQLGWTALALGA